MVIEEHKQRTPITGAIQTTATKILSTEKISPTDQLLVVEKNQPQQK